MSKHLPTTVWNTRLGADVPYQTVRTEGPQHLWLAFFPGNKKDGFSIRIARKDARLLARRINQCLEATK